MHIYPIMVMILTQEKVKYGGSPGRVTLARNYFGADSSVSILGGFGGIFIIVLIVIIVIVVVLLYTELVLMYIG